MSCALAADAAGKLHGGDVESTEESWLALRDAGDGSIIVHHGTGEMHHVGFFAKLCFDEFGNGASCECSKYDGSLLDHSWACVKSVATINS